MSNKRLLRVAETIKRELSFILDRKVEDPRIGMATVTRVDLSDDLRYAKVYVSFMGDRSEREEALRVLRKARRFVRGELAHSLRLRVAPDLTFLMDDSSENYIRISSVLKEIEKENSASSPAGAEDSAESGTETGGSSGDGAAGSAGNEAEPRVADAGEEADDDTG